MNSAWSRCVAVVLTAPPRWVVIVVAALVGLAVGSFLNVVIYRVPRGLSVARPPSFCPRCRTPVRPVDNIPVVSWLVLGGRCRDCGEPISRRYPLVEAGIGALFAAVAAAAGAHWAVPGMCLLAATMVGAAAIELDGLAVGAAEPVVGTLLGAAALAAAAVADRQWGRLVGAGVGLVVAALLAATAARRASAVTGTSPADPPLAAADLDAWALLPAAVLIGWAGPVGAAVGAGLLCVLVPATRWPRAASDAARPRPVGVAVAAALAAGAAVVCGLLAGAPLGR